MTTQIEQARIELAIWEARVVDDKAALAIAEREVARIRDQLAASISATKILQHAVKQWDAMHASNALSSAAA